MSNFFGFKNRRAEDESNFSFVWISSLLLLLFVFTLGSSCGMTTGNNQTPQPLVDDDPPNDPIITFPDDGDEDPIPFTFNITGGQGNDPEDEFMVNTDSVLRLRVTPGPAQNVTVPGVTYTAHYGCVQYSVTVNGRTENTPIMQVDGENHSNCPNGPTSALMDFSDRLTPGQGGIL